MLQGTGAWVEYRPADDVPEGHAHFEIFELPKDRSAVLADELAEIVQPPAPIKPPDNPVRVDALE